MKKFLLLSLALTLITDLFLLKSINKIDDLTLRTGLSPSIFYVLSEAENSGGTGFQLENDKGHTYIISNYHVCSHVMKDGHVKIKNSDGLTMKRRVVDMSEEYDTCLIEAAPNTPALKFGRKWEVGEPVRVLGHPFLFKGTFVKGEISYADDVQIGKFEITPEQPESMCNGKKDRIMEMASLFGVVKICVSTFNAVTTTCQIHPGNSGSPLLNERGYVIGLIFAGNRDTNYGSAIVLEDLKVFVNRY